MISLLSGQIIKISGPQFWKDKKWRDVQMWNKKWCPRSGVCPSPDYCLTGQLLAVIFSSFLAAGEVAPLWGERVTYWTCQPPSYLHQFYTARLKCRALSWSAAPALSRQIMTSLLFPGSQAGRQALNWIYKFTDETLSKTIFNPSKHIINWWIFMFL